MSKKMIAAFCLIIGTIVVLLYNMKGFLTPPTLDVNLVVTTVKDVYTALVLLAFTVNGVVIGLLLK